MAYFTQADLEGFASTNLTADIPSAALAGRLAAAQTNAAAQIDGPLCAVYPDVVPFTDTDATYYPYIKYLALCLGLYEILKGFVRINDHDKQVAADLRAYAQGEIDKLTSGVRRLGITEASAVPATVKSNRTRIPDHGTLGSPSSPGTWDGFTIGKDHSDL